MSAAWSAFARTDAEIRTVPASEHIAERPVVVPAHVDFVAHALVPDIGRQTDALLGIDVHRGRVHHVRAVDDHIAGLVVRNQPARVQLVGHRRQVVGEPAGLHVAVVRADALRGWQGTVPRGKLRLLAAPPRSGTFKVDEPPAHHRDVADGDPAGTETIGPTAQVVPILSFLHLLDVLPQYPTAVLGGGEAY